MRRFVLQPSLTGGDLREMRHSLLGVSQEVLAAKWDMSRNQISRVESMDSPPLRLCDAYVGLTLRKILAGQSAAEGCQEPV